LLNYSQTLQNLGAEGVDLVIYNFMPVLDWVRTDFEHTLPDGATALHFDPVQFAAFEVHALDRPGAEADYNPQQLSAAADFWGSMDAAAQEDFVRLRIEMLPGCKSGFTLDIIRGLLSRYEGIDRATLKANFRHFLRAVVPAAEAAGVLLAVHPDDPPKSVLGLPRIVSCAEDLDDILAMVPSRNNGLCFCVGSFSAGAQNDVPAMIAQFATRIHAVHLRVTKRAADGSFHEDTHLSGCMVPCVERLLEEVARRKASGWKDWQLSFRPDHGHRMMNDLASPPPPNPGYSLIGRMRGLAELRGLQLGLAQCKFGKAHYISNTHE
jgi:mannonate dehydratase